ncbi:DUF6653 family protein [Plastoroseomonas hellenica]|nr:DUF6653 family protein [Plastoroseomonas hellenica]
MTILRAIAGLFRMSDETWRRHANPWSVYTRFAAIPAMIVAIWSRVWIGWWALLPVLLVIVWLLLNPHVFPPVQQPKGWAARGIYGEKLWLDGGPDLPAGHRAVLRWLAIPAVAGFALLAFGLAWLQPWPTVFGATLIILAQLWRIDRLGRLHDEVGRARSAAAAPQRVPPA